MLLALEVDSRDVALALEHVVAVGPEARLLQALAGTGERDIVDEHADDVAARIGESVPGVRIVGHDVGMLVDPSASTAQNSRRAGPSA